MGGGQRIFRGSRLKAQPVQISLLVFVFGCGALVGSAGAETGTSMPAVFEQGLVFLDLPTPDRSTLRLYTDSGGGSLTLSTEAALRMKLAPQVTDDEELLTAFGPNVRVANASEFMLRHWSVLRATASFVVVPGVVAFEGWPATADGTLGTTWFAQNTWTWDYPRGKLILRPKHWRPASDAREFAVAFKTDARGRRTFHYARMMIRVDDIQIPVLFDTGAHTVLTPKALQALHDGQPALRSTSMITHSVFESWRSRNPDWRIVDDAQLSTHSRMILVPSVKIAGVDAGAVWFTEREDEDFHDALSPVMSDVVDGSIGGNAFANLVITVNYPRSRAWVQSKSLLAKSAMPSKRRSIRTSTQ
jgi:hypothetical protein